MEVNAHKISFYQNVAEVSLSHSPNAVSMLNERAASIAF